jgi:cytosine/adenosine deaminase-related metal-dependent hydrolase
MGKSNSTPIHPFSIVPAVVYSLTGSDVETVIIDGKFVMEERKLQTVNEERIIEEAQRAGEQIVDRTGLGRNPRWPVV